MITSTEVRITIGTAVVVSVVSTCIFGWLGFVLSTPLALVFLLAVPRCRVSVVGMMVGWFLWFRDLDFGLNPGGPSAPLRKGILGALHIKSWEYSDAMSSLVPMLVLMAAGCVTGWFCLAVIYLAKYWNKRPPSL